jgi:MFS family permease
MAMRQMERLDRLGNALQESVARYRAAFGERNVALLLAAGFISEIGDWFNIVALVALSFHFTESATGVGGMLAVRMLARLICQGPAGTFVDRHAGRRLLFISQLVMAVIATAFVLLTSIPALWLLYFLVVALEAANCIARPAFMVELRAEAPEEQRAAANGAYFASATTAQLIGPLLGAVALSAFGPVPVFALNGLTFLAVAAAVALMRGGLRGEITANALAMTTHHAASEAPARGYAWLLRRQDLSLYALVCLSLSLLVQATIALFVVRAYALGLGDGGVGLFYAAVAIGSIAGSIVAGSSGRLAIPLFATGVSMVACALALAGFGHIGSVALAMTALVIAGFATDFYEVVGLTYFQHSIPEALYGRFFSVFLLALSAGGLIGALAGPALAEELGAGMSLVALAVPSVALASLLAGLARSWHATASNATD